MKIIEVKDYEEMSKKAADIVAETVKENPEAVLGLATGSSPEGMYENLGKACDDGLDFSKVVSVNLDEYAGIDPENEQSYHYYMKTRLFDRINIKEENTYLPTAQGDDLKKEARAYDGILDRTAPRDIQVLGIGHNGHIAFNEPAKALNLRTSVVELTDDTIEANSRFFDSKEDVPTKALSMGIADILQAKHILLLISGENKKDAMKKLKETEVFDPRFPASAVKLHPNVTVIADEAALGK